jgi:[CysO sulfur-carrier protein]-S-L-cysteine hydrolase
VTAPLPESFAEPTLRLTAAQLDAIVAHCFAGLPDEACGMLTGPLGPGGGPTGEVAGVHPCRNADASAVTYTVDSRDLLRAMRAAEEHGHEIVGVWHSHTHTDPFPSATDVRQAVDPTWIYVLVSLRDIGPSTRAYRIRDGVIDEVRIAVER